MRNEAVRWEGYDGPRPPEEVLRRDPRDDRKSPSEEFSLPGLEGKPRLVEVGPEQPDPAAALEFNVTDEPHEVLRRIHEADGLIGEDGIFKPERGQFELIQAALEGNRDALALITERNGLRQWTEAWMGSAEARRVLDDLVEAFIKHRDENTLELVLEGETLTDIETDLSPEPQPDPKSKPSHRRRVHRRLRPRLGN